MIELKADIPSASIHYIIVSNGYILSKQELIRNTCKSMQLLQTAFRDICIMIRRLIVGVK